MTTALKAIPQREFQKKMFPSVTALLG